jgi:CMP-N-acetylneuraminic acid synthetase
VSRTVAALVPMRHRSERVPNKNFRSFAGRPLYHHIIETLLACPMVSSVTIDTDSPTILDDAANHFPTVNLLERPEKLRSGMVPMNDVIGHDVNHIDSEYFLQTHSTNPLLTVETVTKAIDTFFDRLPENDSLFSVTRRQTRFWDENAEPINHDPAVLMRTQDLPPMFEENSCIYIFSRKSLQEAGNRIGHSPSLFETDPIESWDIDEMHDFTIAEQLYRLRKKGEL